MKDQPNSGVNQQLTRENKCNYLLFKENLE